MLDYGRFAKMNRIQLEVNGFHVNDDLAITDELLCKPENQRLKLQILETIYASLK